MAIYDDLLEAVRARIGGLGLSAVTAVLKRKLPAAEETLDTLPVVCVVPSETPEGFGYPSLDGYVNVIYRVQVVTIAAGNRNYETHLDRSLDWRERIRKAFQGQTLAAVPSVWKATIDPGTPLDRGELNRNYDYGSLTLVFESNESRA